jgi:hypothetical protein
VQRGEIVVVQPDGLGEEIRLDQLGVLTQRRVHVRENHAAGFQTARHSATDQPAIDRKSVV